MAAGFALASYLVTSVWKESIDSKISDYNGIISKASALETSLAALQMSQASLRYLAEGIELQKFQIELTNEKARSDFRLARTFNPNETRAILSEQVFVQDFFAQLDPDVALRHTTPNLPALDPKQLHDSTKEVEACITYDVYPDPVSGQEFSARFADIYQAQADRFPTLEDYPANVREAAFKHLTKLGVGAAAVNSILGDKPPPDNPFDHQPLANYLARKKWAIDCMATARDWTLDYLQEISRQMREAVKVKLVQPLANKKRWVDRLETLLYIASAVIALYEQVPAPERKPFSPIRPPDLNDPRYRVTRRRLDSSST